MNTTATGWLMVALAGAYGFALCLMFLGRRLGRIPAEACLALAAGPLAMPLCIPTEFIMHRAAAAFIATDVAFKLIDFTRHHSKRWNAEVQQQFAWFLVPFPVLAVVAPDLRKRLERHDPAWHNLVRIIVGLPVFAGGMLLVQRLAAFEFVRESPVIDHLVRAVLFVPTIEAISRVLYGLERLAGYDVSPIIRNAYRSRTVAEFWQRYNGRVHLWYERNLFRALKAKSATNPATCVVFLASGLHHELMFGMATSRFTGYQLGFFLLQAPAVIVSPRIERWARRGRPARAVVAHAGTLLFMAITSVFFFQGVALVFPEILPNPSPLP